MLQGLTWLFDSQTFKNLGIVLNSYKDNIKCVYFYEKILYAII